MASVDVALTASEAVAAPVAERGLVEECRRGDAQAFARLVALHEGLVYNLAARLLGDPEEAKDVSQDVFLQVYRMLPRFEGRSSLKTWIYRIVVNQCRNRQRWWRRRKKDKALPLEELTAAESAHAGGAAKRMARKSRPRGASRRRRVQAALLRLSLDHRAVLLLREVEELSGEEIAPGAGRGRRDGQEPAGAGARRVARGAHRRSEGNAS